MNKEKSFDEIMLSITAKLTGEADADIAYLMERSKLYKDHPYGKEIARACGRMIYEALPEEKRVEFDRAANNDKAGFESIMEEVRFNQFQKNYDKALELIEPLVQKYEAAPMFQDDEVSEYHNFKEFIQEILYDYLYEPNKQLRNATIDFSMLYLQYGSLLIDLNRPEDAEEALKKAMKWNPMEAKLAFEYAETFKIRGMMDDYYAITKSMHRILYRSADLARYYRNLGYYFIEKEAYEDAICCYHFSLVFSDKTNANMAQSEIYYISEMMGKPVEPPSREEIEKCFTANDIPWGPNHDVLSLTYAYGNESMKEEAWDAAEYFFNILYALTDEDDIKEKIEICRAEKARAEQNQ